TARNAVFNLHIRCHIRSLPRPGNPGGGVDLQLQIARFLEVVVISHEVWTLLSPDGTENRNDEEDKKCFLQVSSWQEILDATGFHLIMHLDPSHLLHAASILSHHFLFQDVCNQMQQARLLSCDSLRSSHRFPGG